MIVHCVIYSISEEVSRSSISRISRFHRCHEPSVFYLSSQTATLTLAWSGGLRRRYPPGESNLVRKVDWPIGLPDSIARQGMRRFGQKTRPTQLRLAQRLEAGRLFAHPNEHISLGIRSRQNGFLLCHTASSVEICARLERLPSSRYWSGLTWQSSQTPFAM